jgi:hypothetical protein
MRVDLVVNQRREFLPTQPEPNMNIASEIDNTSLGRIYGLQNFFGVSFLMEIQHFFVKPVDFLICVGAPDSLNYLGGFTLL